MKHHLILTIDYELFGNGSGCLNHCVTAPTETCLQTLKKYTAELAFFADATEFKALASYPEIFGQGMQAVETQLVDALNDGHTLQLHIHPQWLGASYENGVWQLDLSKWRIGDLTQDDINRCVAEGLEYLNGIAARSRSDKGQNCKVFRAGGWAVQPGAKVLAALQQCGVEMESTVAPGAYNPARGDWFDFRRSPDLPFWPVREEVCVAVNSDIDNGIASLMEVPITTAKVGKLKHFKSLREHRKLPGLPEGCVGSYDGPNSRWQNYLGKLNKLLRMGTVMLDFSTMPGWMLVEITRQHQWVNRARELPIPIVAIGHNKNFTAKSNENLVYWLDWVADQPDIQFSSYDKWQKAFREVS